MTRKKRTPTRPTTPGGRPRRSESSGVRFCAICGSPVIASEATPAVHVVEGVEDIPVGGAVHFDLMFSLIDPEDGALCAGCLWTSFYGAALKLLKRLGREVDFEALFGDDDEECGHA